MIGTIISAFIMIPIAFFIWNSWMVNKFKWRESRTIVIIIIASVLTLLNYLFFDNIFKFINMTIIFVLIFKQLYKQNLKNSIIAPVMLQTIYFISESLFASLMIIILKNGVNDFVNNYFGNIITNISVSLIALLISRLSFIIKLFKKINDRIKGIDEFTIIFLSFFVLYVYSIFAFNIYYGSNPELLMILSAIISLFAFMLVFLFIKVKSDYYKMYNQYNSSLLSLKELEKALTNHRIDNHENKNHLMTIRNMTKNKKVTNFIDSILDNKIKDDKKIMQETSIIPAGGLRGLIYSKLLLMNSKNIDYELDVSSEVRLVDILDYDDSTMLDICKIVGIFLDNAIEEMDNVEDKYIVIELYKDGDMFKISITNTYDNSVDKSNINKAGVSTKGGNHGYGLSLVKKIINENDKLKTINEITEEEFTQILEIYK